MLNVAIVKVQQKQRAKIFAFLKKKTFFRRAFACPESDLKWCIIILALCHLSLSLNGTLAIEKSFE